MQQIALEEQLVPLLTDVDVAVAGGSDAILADATDRLRVGDVAQDTYPLTTTNADGKPAVILSTDGQYKYVGRLVISFDAAGDIDLSSINATESGAYATDDQGVQDLWGNLTDPFMAGKKGSEVKALTDAVLGIVTAKDGIVYGETDVFLEGRRSAVRTEETNLGNLTADANLVAAQAVDATVQVSIKNGGGIRAEIGFIDGDTGEELPPQANPLSGKLDGEISQLDLENTLKFNNELSLLTLTAEELLEILEHGVAATEPGATPGQFPQVGGVAFSFDPDLPAGTRILSAAIKDLEGNTIDVLVENGLLVGDINREIRIVTLNFLAGGGDDYPFDVLGDNRIDTGIGEQTALSDYLAANFDTTPFNVAETTPNQDGRIQNLMFRTDTVNFPPVVPSDAITLTKIGSYETGIFDEGAAEISAYDKKSQRLFVVNADAGTVDILDLSDPTSPTKINDIDLAELCDCDDLDVSPNSVDVINGLVAVAVAREEASDETPLEGAVVFFTIDGDYLTHVDVGFNPDMLTYTPNKRWLLVANEGEPNDEYTIDPEGSVSIIYVAPLLTKLALVQKFPFLADKIKIRAPFVREADFQEFNEKKNRLMNKGVRIYGPNATVAQDLEPEYIAVSKDSRTAYVALQENNAVAVVNIPFAKVTRISPLGLKDFANEGGLDASNRDDAINIQPWSVFGMYQPDAIASYEVNGTTYLISANEGDSRDYDGFSEEERVNDLDLDPTVFPDAADLQEDEALGRLKTTNANGDLDDDGDVDKIYAYGARSFSIWKARNNGRLSQVFDSGNEFEKITASLLPQDFNSTNDENDSFDNRSDDKGPEPEGVTIGEIDGKTYAFIGLERVGGIMVYDVSKPKAPKFIQYINTRDFSGDAEAGTAGDLGPEGLEFISAADSPNGNALLVVANEVSGTVAVYEIQ